MNDLNSLLVASTVLAIGGLGLFWYKNQDDDFFNDDTNVDNDDDDKSQDYNDNDNDNDDDESDDEYYKKKNAKKNVKKPRTTVTKRNLKKSTGTKRRY